MSVRSEDPPGNRSVGDRVNRAFPIGIGARLTDEVALELETIAGDPTGPHGTTGVMPRHRRQRRERGRELDAMLRTGIGL